MLAIVFAATVAASLLDTLAWLVCGAVGALVKSRLLAAALGAVCYVALFLLFVPGPIENVWIVGGAKIVAGALMGSTGNLVRRLIQRRRVRSRGAVPSTCCRSDR